MSAHLIVGPGALGRLVGLSLAKDGRVTLVGRRPLPVAQTLITPEGEALTLSVPTLTLDRLPSLTDDIVHLATKAYAADAAHAAIAPRLAPATPLVLWQNGFDCQPRLSEYHDGPVLCATTTEGAWLAGDDRVVHAGHGVTFLGDLGNHHLPLARSLATALTAAGLTTAAVPDIRIRLWRKLAVNAAINPLVARFRIRNGQLRDRPFRPMVEAVIEEVAAIMAAEGIAPPDGAGAAGWRVLVWQVVAGTANNRASMLQDVLAGRPTEREAILGPLLAAARRHGIEAPRLAGLDAALARANPAGPR